jgi:hypothetical protein
MAAWAVESWVDVNTAAIRVGRLLEIRAMHYRTVEDVADLFKTIGAEIAKLPRTSQIVTVTDWRFCPVMSEAAAKYALEGMTKNNPRVLRSGALAARGSPIAVLQFLRLVRESKLESRRLFFEEAELKTWMGAVLTDPEKVRLAEFLSERVGVVAGRHSSGSSQS